jgi:heterogeneous nuclear ribonucleoprotein K
MESGGGDTHLRVLVHQSQAGAIIGKAGYKIKELREQTKARIKVYTECCPQSTDRIVEIGGSAETISQTIRTIFEFLHSR